MASRRQAVASQHQIGGAAVGKQKIVAFADAKNRRALGDIGNVVDVRIAEGKPESQINRPITRSFGAQLLANAKAVKDAADANKKSVAVAADAAVERVAAKLAKKVTITDGEKSTKEDKIVATDSQNTVEPNHASSGSSASYTKPSRKKATTFTAVLTARSKVACGLIARPKELIDEIDAADIADQLAVVDYIEDIYKFYKSAEHSSTPHDYMEAQVEINAKMRAILADWLIEVHHKFELMPETLYLTINVIDRYLSMETVLRRELQLVGVSSMLIASKYEEIWAPEVDDFACISDRAYTREQILRMEKRVLDRLEWNLTVPTPYVFLVRFLKVAASGDKEMEHMGNFFAEIALMQYSMTMYCPSMVAASAVYAAQCTLNRSPVWNERLKRHTGFYEHQLLDCAQMLVNSHAVAGESKLRAVYKKYSDQEFGAVALRSPATRMLEEFKASRN